VQEHRSPSPRGFAAVHIAPESSAGVADAQDTRLVIVPPSHVHDRRQGQESAACRWAADVLDRRGTGARTHRNMLVFLAADAARYKELQASVRDYLAWKYVRDNADGMLNLTSQQRQQAGAGPADTEVRGDVLAVCLSAFIRLAVAQWRCIR